MNKGWRWQLSIIIYYLERGFPRKDTRKGALNKKRALPEGKSFAFSNLHCAVFNSNWSDCKGDQWMDYV